VNARTAPSGQTCADAKRPYAGTERRRARVVTVTAQSSPRAVTRPGRPASPSNHASSLGSAQFARPPPTLGAESTAMNATCVSVAPPRSSTGAPNTSRYGPTGPRR
jgi:hypothetical protein